jgi:hypothetical protein
MAMSDTIELITGIRGAILGVIVTGGLVLPWEVAFGQATALGAHTWR